MKLKVVFPIFLVLILGSCSSPWIGNLGPRVKLEITGALIPQPGNARAFDAQLTPRVNVEVRRSAGTLIYSRVHDVLQGQITVNGLPLGEPLTLRLEGLQGSTVLTHWEGTLNMDLDTTEISLQAALVPTASLVPEIGNANVAIGPLKPGEVAFIPWQPETPPLEGDLIHLYFNSGEQKMYVKVFDSRWQPLTEGYHDPRFGGALFPWPADNTVNVMVANVLVSQRNPPEQMTGYLKLSGATLFSSDGTGDGTWGHPAGLNNYITASDHSFFLAEGEYLRSDRIEINAPGLRIYGGFTKDFSQRNGSTIIRSTLLATDSMGTISILNGASLGGSVLEGLTIVGLKPTTGELGAALHINSTDQIRAENCTFQGYSGILSEDLFGYAESAGVYVARADTDVKSIIFSNCTISGGVLTDGTSQSNDISTTGLYLANTSGDNTMLYIYGSTIDGGVAQAKKNAKTQGIYLSSAMVKYHTAWLSGNKIWGGRAVAGGSAGAQSCGIKTVDAYWCLILGNSLVSGGYAETSSGLAVTTGLEMANTSVSSGTLPSDVSFSTIDSGWAKGPNLGPPENNGKAYGIHTLSAPAGEGASFLRGSVILSSTPASPAPLVRVAYWSQGGGGFNYTTNNSFFNITPLRIDQIDYSFFDTQFSTVVNCNYSDEMDLSVPTSSPTNLNSFLAGSWRPVSSAQNLGPVSSEVTEAFLNGRNSLPAFYYDLSGQLRPGSFIGSSFYPGAWTRGAYQQ